MEPSIEGYFIGNPNQFQFAKKKKKKRRNLLEYYSLVHGIKAKIMSLDLKQSQSQESTEAGGKIIQAATIMMDYFFLPLATPLQMHF